MLPLFSTAASTRNRLLPTSMLLPASTVSRPAAAPPSVPISSTEFASTAR